MVSWRYLSDCNYLESDSLFGYCCTPTLLKRMINKRELISYNFKKLFEKYFEKLLTPTPEELTLVDLEFGDGSADAYLQLLEETKKILE